MKPKVKKHKGPRGRITGYQATAYGVEGSICNTPALAVESCEQTVTDALTRLARGGRVFAWRGHDVVVAPTLHGWTYWIDTFSRTDYTVACQGERFGEREDVEDSALFHLAQALWTPDVDDESFVTGLPVRVTQELRGWIRFQRGYAAAKAEGKTDVEAHRIGCEAP